MSKVTNLVGSAVLDLFKGKAPSTQLASPPAKPPIAMYEDPYEAAMWETYNDATNGIGLDYYTREGMASAPQVAPIISTRVRQVRRFAQRPKTRYDYGFRVAMRDKTGSPSKAALKRMEEFTKLIETCGYIHRPEDIFERDLFPTFLSKYARDSLVHDQRNAEFIPDVSGRPSWFTAVDCRTIRRARPKGWKRTTGVQQPRIQPPSHPFVQVIKGTVVSKFDYGQLSFGVRRPRTNVHTRGYGFPELDELVLVITGLLWSLDYNANYFKQGSTTKGIINIVGAMPKDQLRAFRRMWANLVSGVNNAWRTPIVNTPAQGGDLRWIPLHQTNRDMEWSAFTEWLTYLVASAYGMDVAETGGAYNGAKGSKAMFESDNEAKIRASQERGLVPLLQGIEEDLNKHFIWQLDGDFSFGFTGLDVKSESARIELDRKRMGWMTANEIRAEHDQEPRDDCDFIESQIWLQRISAQEMKEESEEGGDEGEGGEKAEADPSPFGAMMWGQGDEEEGGESDDKPAEPAAKGLSRVPAGVSRLEK